MDDLQFDKRVWSLHEALHWIAFGRHDVPATEDSATRFEQAEVGLLGEWQDGNISPRGCEKGSGTPQEIPRDFSTKAEFDSIGNSIYQEGWGQPEPRWKEVCFFRADVLALWPDTPWPDQSAPQAHDAQPSTPAKADQAQTDNDLKDWFVNIYVPAHKDDSPNPTRDAALSAAKPEFANYCDQTHLRHDLRKIWRAHAPKEWKKTGPRAKTEQIIPAK